MLGIVINLPISPEAEPISPAYLLASDASTRPPKFTIELQGGSASSNNNYTYTMAKSYTNTTTISPNNNNANIPQPSFSSPMSGVQVPSTIRTVSSFEAPSDSSSSDVPSARNSAFSSSVNSNASGTSEYSQSNNYQYQNGSGPRLKAPTFQTASAMSSSSATLRDGATTESHMNGADDASHAANPLASSTSSQPAWDSTVGKAALGKTGRVINKLVSDNDALKRELKLEQIKSEEAKATAKLMEDKMERTVSEYESRLLEANVTKTLLSRKERQVESLQSSLELEKKRTSDAVAREQTWREELEKSRRDATVQVEEAKTLATLMEGRYNAISSHWKDQGDEVKRATTKLRTEITTLVDERRKDDDRINTLRDLCDQQDGNIRDLKRQKDEIVALFEAYKKEQEDALRTIKREAAEREEEQKHTLEEAHDVLDKLRWALKVKENVKGAQ